jgi:hypothetical protein
LLLITATVYFYLRFSVVFSLKKENIASKSYPVGFVLPALEKKGNFVENCCFLLAWSTKFWLAGY